MDSVDSNKKTFSDLLESCNLAQYVNGPTHIHGHTLDLILTPIDSNVISTVHIGDFMSDHAIVKCKLDFSPPLPVQNKGHWPR